MKLSVPWLKLILLVALFPLAVASGDVRGEWKKDLYPVDHNGQFVLTPRYESASYFSENTVRINTQASLRAVVGQSDWIWEYPSGLLPQSFSGLTYVSGPGDTDLAPKAAWQKPTTLADKQLGIQVDLNCYRRQPFAAPPTLSTPKGASTAPLFEPDYRYRLLRFHKLPAAEARWEGGLHSRQEIVVFVQDSTLYKIVCTGNQPPGTLFRKAQVVAKSIRLFQSRQPRVDCKITGGLHGGDTITLARDTTRGVCFRVAYNTGISRAEITLVSGDWPNRITLDFVGFRSLESLALEYNDLRLATSLGTAPSVEVTKIAQGTNAPYAKGDTRFQIPISRDRNGIRVEIPVRWLTGKLKVLKISWIDAYRG